MARNIISYKNRSGICCTNNESSAMTAGLNAFITTRKEQIYCMETSQAELSKLQRMACLGITGAMRMAPTAAMEILLGLPPLHL
jgi:hypothetical protein